MYSSFIIFQTTIFHYQIFSGEDFLETIQPTPSGVSSKFLTLVIPLLVEYKLIEVWWFLNEKEATANFES